ncbi:Secretory carrier-associated membrane protein 1 [Portunus trituberculatus]|uniref:Secretory carrier-associated membrane protein 1 n=1 Tax=Portunus trituberculatus TaxID=210409 RepID=A0A5B7EVB6_PORTR|nr:Secretory carrier-associated membrane protein 1 [Portunus trituberculatus]
MSNFDDNPFADPFSEPSIQQATRNTTSGLEEYDPFSGKPATQTVPTTVSTSANMPAPCCRESFIGSEQENTSSRSYMV